MREQAICPSLPVSHGLQTFHKNTHTIFLPNTPGSPGKGTVGLRVQQLSSSFMGDRAMWGLLF